MRETTMRRNYALLGVVMAAVVGLTACSSDSPTAPPASPTPAAYSIALTASPSQAETNTAITVSAKITSGTQNAPDGTSVTFSLTGCVPTDATTPHFENGTCEMVRTTSSGVATAVILSAVDGTYELVARVAGASAKLLVKFYYPVNPRALAIYSVAPNRGRPEGGEQVLIRGRGFAAPLTVDFEIGGAARHAAVVSVNAEGTQIVVVTPATEVDATTEQVADITVTAGANTDAPVSDTLTSAFIYEAQFSGPMIYSIVPPSGLVTGGETVVIYGANFFTPVRVEFGSENVQVNSVAANGSSITLTTPQHSGAAGPVTVTIYTRYATAQQEQIARANGFTWLPVTTDPQAPVVYQVLPNRGTPRGGESVTLIGANLCGLKDTVTGQCIAAPEVSFQIGPPISATRTAEVTQFAADGRTLTIVTPEASPNPVITDVPTTINVTNPAGSYAALNAFTYVGEARPPIIYYLDPDRGSARGGDTVTIYGRFFMSPATVTFSPGGSAEVVEVAPDGTYIIVVTPAAQVEPLAQDTLATVTVVSQAGTGRDSQVALSNAYLYIAEEPTPVIFSLTPNSGPIEGGTRVTIFGEGFQYPVQVLFGDHQAEVVSSNFNEVIVVAPSITPSEPNTPTTVQVTVKNMLTGKVSNQTPYRYGEAMFISAISPLEGPDIGGTIVTIFGQGFVAPVAVTIDGVEATVLSVAGTEIVVRTNAPGERSCTAQSGPVIVTNINSNISATGPTYTYRPARPLIAEAEVVLNSVPQGDNIIDEHDQFGVVGCQTPTPSLHRLRGHPPRRELRALPELRPLRDDRHLREPAGRGRHHLDLRERDPLQPAGLGSGRARHRALRRGRSGRYTRHSHRPQADGPQQQQQLLRQSRPGAHPQPLRPDLLGRRAPDHPHAGESDPRRRHHGADDRLHQCGPDHQHPGRHLPVRPLHRHRLHLRSLRQRALGEHRHRCRQRVRNLRHQRHQRRRPGGRHRDAADQPRRRHRHRPGQRRPDRHHPDAGERQPSYRRHRQHDHPALDAGPRGRRRHHGHADRWRRHHRPRVGR